jgi:hypothetical protein
VVAFGETSRLLLFYLSICWVLSGVALADSISIDTSGSQVKIGLGTSDGNGAAAQTTGTPGQIELFGTGLSIPVTAIGATGLSFNYQGNNQGVVLNQNPNPFTSVLTSPIAVSSDHAITGALMDDDTTGGGNSFDYSGFTGTGTLTDYGSAADSLFVEKNSNVTLSDTSISSSDGMNLSLNNVNTVTLTNNSSTENPFNIDLTNWSGTKTLHFNNQAPVTFLSTIVLNASSTFVINNPVDGPSSNTVGGGTNDDLGLGIVTQSTITNNSSIAAGNATGGDASVGVGVAFLHSGGTLNNEGEIYGGLGLNGQQIYNDGTPGGHGVAFLDDPGTVNNSGQIFGGNGGTGYGGNTQGGDGGIGIYMIAGGTVNNSFQGQILGGSGGTTNGGDNGQTGASIKILGGVGTINNAGQIFGDVLMDNYANTVTLFTGSVIGGNLDMSNNPNAILTLDGTGAASYSSAVNGVTTFSGTLVKQGSGSWTIDRSLNPTGGVTIAGGQLTVSGTGSISGPVKVGSGATLGGQGTINGDVTVQSGGKLYPGDPSVTTVNGNVTLNTGATSSFSIANTATPSPPNKVTAGTDYDQVNIRDTSTASNLTIQSGATLEIVNLGSLQFNSIAYVPTGPNTDLINYFVFALQSGVTSGQFDFFSDGATSEAIVYSGGIGRVTLDNIEVYISYTGNLGPNSTTGGHDVVLTAYSADGSVPEPATWASLLIGGGLLVIFHRFRADRERAIGKLRGNGDREDLV